MTREARCSSARAVLDAIGLGDTRRSLAGDAGARRAARARGRPGARQPAAPVLLDEPMAGMGHDESARMVGADRERSSAGGTMLLVEHDMDAVFRLADRISVLVDGRVIASGAPDEMRRDADVRRGLSGRGVSEVAA